MLTIGDLAERTGVATTALRYYDDLGLVRAATRVGGQRRYDEDAAKQIAVVLLLRDTGFTLEEIRTLVAGGAWRPLAEAKLAELDQQAAKIATARVALQHALDCPAKEPANCPRFWAIVERKMRRISRPASAVR